MTPEANGPEICVAPGCDRPWINKGSRTCNRCGQRALYHGGKVTPVPVSVKVEGCKIPDCPGKHFSNGYCFIHNSRWKNRGKPARFDGGEPIVHQPCKLFGCGELRITGVGYCRNHLQGWQRDGCPENWRPVDRETHRRLRGGRRLVTPGRRLVCKACGGKHFSNGYCARDYNRWRQLGRPKEGLPEEQRSTSSS